MKRWQTLLGVAGTASLVTAVAATIAVDVPRRIIWNVSASVPLGLYVTTPVQGLRVGELVAVRPPQKLATFMASRHYLGAGVPMLKHIAALPGQSVCRRRLQIRIDGRPVTSARLADSRGRPLPGWRGCHRVTDDEVFLLNTTVSDSFDGRYFGAVPRSTVIGRAVPIWTWRSR